MPCLGTSEARLVSARSDDDRSLANQQHRLVAFPNAIFHCYAFANTFASTTCSMMAITGDTRSRRTRAMEQKKRDEAVQETKGIKRRSRSEPCRPPTLTLTTARTYSRCSTRRTEQSTKKPKNQKRKPRPSDRTNPYRPGRSTPPRGHRGRYVDPRPHTTRRRSTPRATRHRQRRARESLRKKKDIEKHIKLIAHTKIERN
jgi:hypothetical protein